jgi:ABC-type cobalt transport system, permease component
VPGVPVTRGAGGQQQQGWHGKRPDPHGKVCYSRVEAVGIWLLGGVLGGLIIRKPGAALAVELLAALVSAAVGNQWGITTLYSGLAQGIGGANGIGTYGPAVASQIPTVLESGSDSACLARSPCWCHIRGAGTAKRIHHFPCPSSRVWSSRCRPSEQ